MSFRDRRQRCHRQLTQSAGLDHFLCNESHSLVEALLLEVNELGVDFVNDCFKMRDSAVYP